MSLYLDTACSFIRHSVATSRSHISSMLSEYTAVADSTAYGPSGMGMGGQSWYSWMSEHIGSTVASTAIGMTIMGVAGYYGCKAAGWISGKKSSISQSDDRQSNQGERLPPIEMLDKDPESCPREWERGQAYTHSYFSSVENPSTISHDDMQAIRQALQNFSDHPDIKEGTDLTFTTDQQVEDAYYLQSVKSCWGRRALYDKLGESDGDDAFSRDFDESAADTIFQAIWQTEEGHAAHKYKKYVQKGKWPAIGHQ